MLIGLTGGMGAGKSSALQCFKNLKVDIRNADEIVNTIYKENKLVKKKIIGYFGEEIIKNNAIIKDKLADIVFQDEKKLSWLTNLIHPIIKKQILEKTTNITIAEVPLLFEKKWHPYFYKTISVWRNPKLIKYSKKLHKKISA